MPREVESPAEWIRYAKSDLALSKGPTSLDVMLEMLCFHAQQAVEKSIKAILIAKSIPFPRMHHLDALIGLLPADVPMPPDEAEVVGLTEFAVTIRYHGLDEPVTEEEYREAVRLAESVVRWAEDLLCNS